MPVYHMNYLKIQDTFLLDTFCLQFTRRNVKESISTQFCSHHASRFLINGSSVPCTPRNAMQNPPEPKVNELWPGVNYSRPFVILDILVSRDTCSLISSCYQKAYLVCACEVTKIPIDQLASNLSLRDVNEVLIYISLCQIIVQLRIHLLLA